MTLWLTIFGMGVITYVIRLSFILLLENVEIPARVKQALKYVPTAVLSAIIVPQIFRPAGPLDFSLGNLRIWAGLIAILVAWRTKNTLWTVVIGMAVLWLLQFMTNAQ